MQMIRNGFWKNSSLFFPRFGLDSISITEIGSSGFGDRLRGIGTALFLVRYNRVKTLYYDDKTRALKPIDRNRHFPFNMCDLISLNGIEFREGSPPSGERCLRVCHVSNDASKMTLLGLGEFWRIEPVNGDINNRLLDLGVGKGCIGFHVRGTDALTTFRFKEGMDFVENRGVENLKAVSQFLGTKKVFLATDSYDSQKAWIARLKNLGYEVIYNSGVNWNIGGFRETGAEDMLLDFFGLAGCGRVVRLVPSEFSRFAAWKAGRKLRYFDLY